MVLGTSYTLVQLNNTLVQSALNEDMLKAFHRKGLHSQSLGKHCLLPFGRPCLATGLTVDFSL